jgi:hypothetical protein
MKHILAPAVVLLLTWQAIFAQEIPTQLNLVVVSGEGALYRTGERVSQPPQVRVEDQEHKPISGAAVVFTLPASAATGDFERGGKTLTVTTDDKGIAVARGLRISEDPGRFEMLVNVAYRGLTANTSIAQFSTAPNGAPQHKPSSNGGGISKKWIAILVIAGAAGAAGAVAASHGSSSSSSGSGGGGGGGGGGAATISITVGSSSVTHP